MNKRQLVEIRKHNLNTRIAKMGGQSAFIEKTGMNQGQVSSLQNNPRSFGEKVARNIEALAQWPAGCLDVPIDGGIGDPLEVVEAAFKLMPYVDDIERDRMLWHLKRLRDTPHKIE
jgi:hypothetical protein